MAKSILLIGGNGYIGTRIYKELVNVYNVHSIDIGWFGTSTYSEAKDYRNLLQTELSKYDVIILFAGHSSVKMCDGPVISSWNNNVNNFINLIKKLDKSQTLIYASSGSVYGSKNIITTEDIPLEFKPINNYDLTKYTIDVEAERFIKSGYKIVGLRLGTVNGYSDNFRDELMINSMVKKSIYENTVSVSNKTILRPILGLKDLSDAIIKIIENPISGIYNMCSFIDSVENIGTNITTILGTKIQETINVSNSYDFTMDSQKFQTNYNFNFKETIDTIVAEITNNIEKVMFTNRNNFKDYV